MAKVTRSIVAGDHDPDPDHDPGPPRVPNGPINTPIGAIKANTQFELAADEYNKIEQVLAELDVSGAHVIPMRRRRGETGYVKLTPIPVELFKEADLINTWGGGEYVLAVFDSNNRKVKGPITLKVAEEVRGSMDAPKTPPAAPAAPVSSGPDLAQLSELVNKDKDVMMKVMETGQQRSDQMMQMFLQMMMESQKATMQAIATMSRGGSQSSEPLSNILTAMMPLLMEGLLRKKDESPLFKSVEDIMKMRELFETTGEKDTMFDKLIPLLAPVVAGLTQRPQLPAPARQANLNPPAGAPPPPPAEPPAPDPIGAVVLQVRQVLPVLINAARNGTDPVTYADLLFDMTDEATQDVLCGILERPDWQEILFANHPGVLQQSAWFESLRNEILKTDEPQPTDVSGGSDSSAA